LASPSMPRVRRNEDVETEETLQTTFEDLRVPSTIVRALDEMGVEHPSPVQLRAIPPGREGRDLIVQAKSGTGKTIAFGTILLEGIVTSEATKQALVLAPTREIALQIRDELRRLGWYLDPAPSIEAFVGGVPEETDVQKLTDNACHVLVGTPGRIHSLIDAKHLPCKNLRFFVLDEADKLLSEDFVDTVKSLFGICYNPELICHSFSATFLPPYVSAAEKLVQDAESNHLKQLQKRAAKKGVAVPEEASAIRPLPTKIFLCSSAIKRYEPGAAPGAAQVESAVLRGVSHYVHVMEGYHVRHKVPVLLDVMAKVPFRQAMIFCNRPEAAAQTADILTQVGIAAAATSGRMDQKWREQAFVGLKTSKFRALVCSDVMARGVDVAKVDLVVNLDLPCDKETYLHRSGRAARFGTTGSCVSILFPAEEGDLQYFAAQVGFEVAPLESLEEGQSAEQVPAPPDAAPGPATTVPDVPERADIRPVPATKRRKAKVAKAKGVEGVALEPETARGRLLSRFPPPPVQAPIHRPGLGWDPQMFECATYREYRRRAGGGGTPPPSKAPCIGPPAIPGIGTTADRLDRLWRHHLAVWQAVA